jgi:hypothetical protein
MTSISYFLLLFFRINYLILLIPTILFPNKKPNINVVMKRDKIIIYWNVIKDMVIQHYG